MKSWIRLVCQAPGDKGPQLQKPFAWTTGKTMFNWFDQIGLDEEAFRQQVYIAAVCRCFPGKNPKGGDRAPNPDEIAACRVWLDRELALNQPELLLPVGKLAITNGKHLRHLHHRQRPLAAVQTSRRFRWSASCRQGNHLRRWTARALRDARPGHSRRNGVR